jgi:3'-5' exonuclease
MDRPLAAFDIEATPDPEIGRRVLGLEGDDATVIPAMLARREQETDGRTSFFQPPFHRIVAISVAWLDPSQGAFRLGTFGTACGDEPRQIREFFQVVAKAPVAPRLVSWNGNGFDMPVLRYRAMLHGIQAPEMYRSDGPWKYNNYHARYHDMHVDLMDVLAGYGSSDRVGLDALSRILGLPGKTVTSGEDVWRHVLAGEDEIVRTYCELDALTTLLLYMQWAHHRGNLDDGALARHLDRIATYLEAGSKPDWHEMAAALRRWPTWLRHQGLATK